MSTKRWKRSPGENRDPRGEQEGWEAVMCAGLGAPEHGAEELAFGHSLSGLRLSRFSMPFPGGLGRRTKPCSVSPRPRASAR